MTFTLFTTASGIPILIAESGMVIEPEITAGQETGNSIVTLPHTNRDGKPKITVKDSFANILGCVEVVKVLDKASQEKAKQILESTILSCNTGDHFTPPTQDGPIAEALEELIKKPVDAAKSRGKKKEVAKT